RARRDPHHPVPPGADLPVRALAARRSARDAAGAGGAARRRGTLPVGRPRSAPGRYGMAGRLRIYHSIEIFLQNAPTGMLIAWLGTRRAEAALAGRSTSRVRTEAGAF